MTFCGEKSALVETRLRKSRPLKPARNRKDRSTLCDYPWVRQDLAAARSGGIIGMSAAVFHRVGEAPRSGKLLDGSNVRERSAVIRNDHPKPAALILQLVLDSAERDSTFLLTARPLEHDRRR